YTEPSTDPFDPGSFNLAEQARSFFKNKVESSFDIGHVFHYLGASSGLRASGVAYLDSSCKDYYKGGGWTGTNSPGSIDFNMQVFGHEIAHQMGADHSFYGKEGSCAGSQRSRGHGLEPGAGSTMMSYQNQ